MNEGYQQETLYRHSESFRRESRTETRKYASILKIPKSWKVSEFHFVFFALS